MLENRIGEYRGVVPLLHRIRSIGICTDKLLTFSLIVDEKAQTSDLLNPRSFSYLRVNNKMKIYENIYIVFLLHY
jgi:hypothetical protein